MSGTLLESRASWTRLAACMALSSIGGVGMWSVVVVLPSVQAEFGVDRGSASLAYTLTMLGFAAGGVAMGRLTDRFGLLFPVVLGSTMLASGFVLAGLAQTLWQFVLVQGLLIGGLGSSATFGPLIADVSQWFVRRRGIAVALCASGNYIAGTVWPPIVSAATNSVGWRATYIGVGLFCAASMLPLALMLRRRAPVTSAATDRAGRRPSTLGFSPGMLQALLWVAGLACCVAMSMPQVHIVAYCGDLGYGAARGSEMLSLMLGFGVMSRIGSGFLADWIGGLPTLLLGSVLQGVALLLYTQFDSLTSLYVISAMFGLFQGGIVPSYAVVVRDCFPAREAGTRVGLVLMATLVGMALGGWMSGVIDDWTGSYHAAFVNGVLWNALNAAIVVVLLLRRSLSRPAPASAAA